MKLKLSIILLSACLFVSAQKPHTVLFDKVELFQEYEFDIIEWVDLRPDKSNIGWAQKGISNRRVFAVLNSPIEEIMQYFFPEKGHDLKVAVRFKQLFINEVTKATKEYGFADVSLEIFTVVEGKYNYLETISYSSKSKATDVTRKHGQNILNAVNGALSYINTDITSDILLTNNEWKSENPIYLNTDNLPIINESPKEGFFLTLKEFIENKPREAELRLEEKKQFVKVSVSINGAMEELLHGFAVAKNGTIYIRYQEGFHELRNENGSFVFDGPIRVDANQVSTGAIVGGAIGAGIVAAASKERWKYKLDLATGEKVQVQKLR